MIIESFIKSALIPGVVLTLGMLFTQKDADSNKAAIQGLLACLGFLVGTYFLKGIPSWPPDLGLEGLQWIAIAGFLYCVWPSMLVTTLLLLVALLFPIYQGSGWSEVFVRNAAAFGLLTISLWGFSEKQMRNGFGAQTLMIATVSSGAASLYALVASSAYMSQVFAILATFSGLTTLYALLFKARFSFQMASVYLVAFPLLLIGGMHFYMGVNPYIAMALALPYSILFIRSYFPMHHERPWFETILMGILGVGSVSWLFLGKSLF